MKLLMTAFLWGGTFIAGRIVAQKAGPFSAAFLRFVFASAVLMMLSHRLEGKLPLLNRHQVVPIVLLGLTGILAYNVLFFLGLQSIHAGRAALIVATNPIVIALLSAYFFKERLYPTSFMGILLSIIGAIVVITDGHVTHLFQQAPGWGEVCIFGCVLCWAIFSLIGKSLLASLSPLVTITYASVVGTAGLAVPALMEGLLRQLPVYSVRDWACLVYLGLFGTAIGFVWYYDGIRKIGPAAASQFINFVPISAVLLSYFILAEPITISLLVGILFVCSGVYLVKRTALRRSADSRHP